MSAQLVYDGLEELRAALRSLPADLALEAGPIVTAAAERLQQDAQAAYPARTGHLRNGVRIGTIGAAGRFGVAMTVRSTAKHAWIFERGTAARKTSKGWSRGAMPKGDLFIPLAIRTRTAMYQGFRELLERHGFEVRAS
jgi:hypothetical protein